MNRRSSARVAAVAILLLVEMFSATARARVWPSGQQSVCLDDTWTPIVVPDSPLFVNYYPFAVWTGQDVLLWAPTQPAGLAGQRYSPSSGTFAAMSATGQPNLYSGPDPVWTGQEMIVWGFEHPGQTATAGGRYDPLTDSWTPISSLDAPSNPYVSYASVWTGTEMLVWGGTSTDAQMRPNGGARYDPATDTWTPISILGAPSSTNGYTVAVWTGSEMLVFETACSGGLTGPTCAWIAGAYDPKSDTWRNINTSGAPAPSESSGIHIVWTGSKAIVWGGDLIPGGLYDLKTDSWSAMSTEGLPAAVEAGANVILWGGREMLVWGPLPNLPQAGVGAKYDPLTNRWSPISQSGAPPAGHYAGAWTGQQLIVIGVSASAPQTGFTMPEGGVYCSASAAACTYTASPVSSSFLSIGGQGSVSVEAQGGCSWTAVSNDDWITTSSNNGSGNGVVSYTVAPNSDPAERSGSLTVAGQMVTVTEIGAPNIGSIFISGKNLVVDGVNFDSGAKILINGTPQKTIFNGPETLTGKKTAKRIPSGTAVSVQVKNGDGALSQPLSFMKP